MSAAPDGTGGADAPLCFLHVPKCAGTSVHLALEAALPPGAVAPCRSDTAIFGGYRAFDELNRDARALVAVGDAERAALAGYRVVSGHFALSTLLDVAPAANVATILREPRVRVLSSFKFLQVKPVVAFWGAFGREVLAQPASTLVRWLSDRSVASMTDNQICRLLMHGDPRLPIDRFLEPRHAVDVAAAAIRRLDRLGYVGLIERDDVWRDLSAFMGATLDPVRANVSRPDDASWSSIVAAADLRSARDLVEARNVADRLVYEHVLVRRHGAEPAEARAAADAALEAELASLGEHR